MMEVGIQLAEAPHGKELWHKAKGDFPSARRFLEQAAAMHPEDQAISEGTALCREALWAPVLT